MSKEQNELMIYGAGGYSAQLIIEELVKKGIKPLLAGRNENVLKLLSDKFGCMYKTFEIEEEKKIDEALSGVHTLLNCAGPFKYTAKEMMEACLRTKTNYLDITGEIPVMHLAFSLDTEAKEKGITIMPSVGFDIIPSDCLAKKLSDRMPDAISLKLGFLNKRGKISRGTWLTTLEFLGGSGRIRRAGKVIESKIGEFKIKVEEPGFSFYGISIPWGDVYSSYHSTGIPNAEVYLGVSKMIYQLNFIFVPLLRLFRNKLIKNFAANFIKRNLSGPSKAERDLTETYVFGKVENSKGESIEEIYQFMEGYNLTAVGAAECCKRVLENQSQAGYSTPSMAFGSEFMSNFVIEKIK